MGTCELWQILREIDRAGLLCRPDGRGHNVEAVCAGGRYWVTETATRYELDVLAGMAPRLAEIAPAIAKAVGATSVAIEEQDGRVFAVVAHRPEREGALGCVDGLRAMASRVYRLGELPEVGSYQGKIVRWIGPLLGQFAGLLERVFEVKGG